MYKLNTTASLAVLLQQQHSFRVLHRPKPMFVQLCVVHKLCMFGQVSDKRTCTVHSPVILFKSNGQIYLQLDHFYKFVKLPCVRVVDAGTVIDSSASCAEVTTGVSLTVKFIARGRQQNANGDQIKSWTILQVIKFCIKIILCMVYDLNRPTFFVPSPGAGIRVN